MTPPRIGSLPSGPRDAISDVGEIRVGHVTLDLGAIQTGVTVVVPHAGDPFADKVPAAAAVINGFGKSVGLIQVEELGVFETPIALTNTFSVGAVMQAQIRAAMAAHPKLGREWATVNPLVFECNDGYLNDIRALAVTEEHYRTALENASFDFVQGSIGAGRGMSAFELKGGIGTASRRAGDYTVGALVLANHGRLPTLTLAGHPLGRKLTERKKPADEPEKGSIIMLLATDAPLDARQLRRLALRAGAGLARTGSVFGHGSGDIALAFSTAYTLPHLPERPMPALAMLHETRLDPLFHAAADATEQAIIHALWHAEPVRGRDGHKRRTLREILRRLPDEDNPCAS
ncbi:DmpA family aminopeptidase [Propionivibrio sp.]|uniref:DmpA family aminopeptidase n=1 Tax=Propionivibrio sp. TaxID=2212460 RepID=UPI00272DC9A5|nr:P1 family peptidase [Propionivibrio sp.]